mgnify:CR=1 FL=1
MSRLILSRRRRVVKLFFELIDSFTCREVLGMIQAGNPFFLDGISGAVDFHEAGFVREIVLEPSEETTDLTDLVFHVLILARSAC